MTMSSLDERSAERKEHERRAAVILDGMYQFVALLNLSGDILEVNRAALEGAGHQIQEIRGKPFWTARWWQVSEQIKEQLRVAIQRAAAGEFVRYEVEIYGGQSGLVPITIDFSLLPIRGESGEVEYLLPEGRNITERKLAEDQVASQAAQAATALLSAIVDSSDDAIISKDLNGIITSWNKSAERLFGYTASEAVGQPVTMLIPPDRLDEEPKILERLKRGERVDHFETIRMRKDGSRLDISLTISPVKDADGRIVGASKVARDITERARLEQQRREFSRELEKQVSERTAELQQANRALLQDIEERERLEEQLRQSQKLESMGALAAGVAHDLNNLLNIIQGYASVLGPGATNEDIEESADAITETTKRGAVLVQQLLASARKTETKMESVDVNTLIQGLGNLIKGTFPKNIETSLSLAPIPLRIMADASQITQVLLNLCVNARDAMPDGGSLALKTSMVDERELGVYGALLSEEYVSIEITDTGTGMDESVQKKIFEPFFTTKEIGKGTGLGLAVVYGIVKSHNGSIQVESQPMHGTTFRLYFPAVSLAG